MADLIMEKVYLDHSATTPVRAEVLEAMLPYFSDIFGNASSPHSFGQAARKAIQTARKSVARVLGAGLGEVIFTSGGTESDNLAIKGVARAMQRRGNHIITSSVEHPAVLNCCRDLEKEGFKVTYLPVDGHGQVNKVDVESALRPETILVSIMLANNEVGTLQPVREIGEITRAAGVVLHTDAVQAVGKIAARPGDLNVDLLSVSGHKLDGPKGTGALYIRKGTPFAPLMHGGHHEMGFRPGTENLAGVVGLAKAIELADGERAAFTESVAGLRSNLEKGIRAKISEMRVNGHATQSLPNILNVSFKKVDGESLLLVLDSKNIAVSTGSACSSGSAGQSHVLTAMGIGDEWAGGSIRFSLGRGNSAKEISRVLEILPGVVEGLRK
jgi:cysteine desulfurase